MCFAENAPSTSRKQIKLFQTRVLEQLRFEAAQLLDDSQLHVMQLLVKLPALRALSPLVMEELFFAGARSRCSPAVR